MIEKHYVQVIEMMYNHDKNVFKGYYIHWVTTYIIINNIKIISENLHRRATSPGGGAGRPDSDHVSRAAGVAFAPGRLAIALPVQEQGAKNTLFFASYSILSVTQRDSVGFRCAQLLRDESRGH